MDKWVKKLVIKCLPVLQNLNPLKIIIFGSSAREDAKEYSDIDVILLSGLFRDIPFFKRMSLVLRMMNYKKHIDFLCYTQEEFEKIKENSVIVRQALKEGIDIFPRIQPVEVKDENA